ncbi:ATP-binding protein [Nocardiopsis ansamitocini]|nr:ATP-binding protein [Nocardiopsis ansamitocini]
MSAGPKVEGSSFTHDGLLFHSPSELCAAVVPLIRSAAAHGDHIVAVLGAEPAEAVRQVLPDRQHAAVNFVERESFYDAPGRTLAALHRLTLLHPDQRITVIGQPVLPDEIPLELREWQRLDSVLGVALSGARMSLRCVHDANALSGAAIESMYQTHPAMVGPDGPQPNPRCIGHSDLMARTTAEPLSPPEGPVEALEIISDLPTLRDQVVRVATAMGVPKDRAGDLVVAVNEMAANVLEHGAGKGTISLWRPAGRIVCDVFDEGGRLTDPLSGYYPVDSLSVRGYGLWITRQVCDFMEVRGGPGGSIVRLHFKV